MKVTAAVLFGSPAVALLLAGCNAPQPGVPADAIYSGGPIVTVYDAQPTAEALAVRDGTILAVGSKAAVERAHRGAATKMIDLGGRTLAPGFVDTRQRETGSEPWVAYMAT